MKHIIYIVGYILILGHLPVIGYFSQNQTWLFSLVFCCCSFYLWNPKITYVHSTGYKNDNKKPYNSEKFKRIARGLKNTNINH